MLGTVVGAIGWRLHARYRTYGAALLGCGAGIIYLSVWAACRLYEVIPSTIGIVGLALVSVALAMIAFAINVEALGLTAALGAFMAPVLLGSEQVNSNLLLLYLSSMAAGLGLEPPELVTLEASDGTPLHGAIYRPAAEGAMRRAPVVVSVYGGPHAQRVADDWSATVDMRAQYLAEQGFVVFKLDNRGSAGSAGAGRLAGRRGVADPDRFELD